MGFKVTDTRESQTITQAGTPVTKYRVWIVTDKGATGMIEVSPDDWSEEKLLPILIKKAEDLDLAFTIAQS